LPRAIGGEKGQHLVRLRDRIRTGIRDPSQRQQCEQKAKNIHQVPHSNKLDTLSQGAF
jgi:hypothetical protein